MIMQLSLFNFEQEQRKNEGDLLYVFISELKCRNVSEAIDYFGYPIAFRQAFKKWKQKYK